jgi:hypothetical protein
MVGVTVASMVPSGSRVNGISSASSCGGVTTTDLPAVARDATTTGWACQALWPQSVDNLWAGCAGRGKGAAAGTARSWNASPPT